MLAFFRRIRKGLLGGDRISNYILYAIGEIALVVMGILIALQINSWKEYRNDREMELKILTEIRSNLIVDLNDHVENMGFIHHIVNSSKVVLDHLEQDLPYDDSLDLHFGWLAMGSNFDAVTSGHELMLSKGVHIVQNDSLRNKISILYGRRYKWLRSFLKDRQYLDRPFILGEMIENFDEIRIYDSATPTDYNALKRNDSFKSAVSHHSYVWELTARFYGGIIDEIEELITELEHEIERLD